MNRPHDVVQQIAPPAAQRDVWRAEFREGPLADAEELLDFLFRQQDPLMRLMFQGAFPPVFREQDYPVHHHAQ